MYQVEEEGWVQQGKFVFFFPLSSVIDVTNFAVFDRAIDRAPAVGSAIIAQSHEVLSPQELHFLYDNVGFTVNIDL